MSRPRRLVAAFRAGWRAFVRRRTALFFTFFFPAILIAIFGALVSTEAGGLFARQPQYYVPGYLAVVVVFTPLSRVSSEVTRHDAGRQFEKLATTPLQPWEWLFAGTLVNTLLVGAASVLVLVLVVLVTGASIEISLWLVPAIVLGTVLFCGLGSIIGRIADSRDGAIAASNGIGLPLLFLSDTFVPPELLPSWFRPLLSLSPLTYFARASREALTTGNADMNLVILAILAAVSFGVGVYALPWRS